MKRWATLCYQKLPVIPPSAKQLKELIPIQKKEEVELEVRKTTEENKEEKKEVSKCITGVTFVPFFPVNFSENSCVNVIAT